MKLNLTEKNKNIFKVILIVAILFASYNYGYLNLSQMNEEMKAEKDALTAKYKTLYPLYTQRDEYKKQAASLTEEYEEMIARYPANTTQESLILLAKSIEEDTDVWFSTLSMTDPIGIYNFGRVMSTNPLGSGGAVYSSDNVGRQSTMTMNYSTTYENGKKLIEYLNTNNNRKFTIDSATMTYTEVEDQLSGTIVVSTYDVAGSGREYENVSVHNVPVGTKNIFVSNSFLAGSDYNPEEGDSIINNYDIYAMTGSFSTDADTAVVGLANDAFGKTVTATSSNSVENVTLTISGKNGEYKVSYKVGSMTYPAENYFEGATLNCGDTLDMLIMSSARDGKEDKAGIKLNVVNNSDKELNIKIINDDENNPRVTMGTNTGSIKLYR